MSVHKILFSSLALLQTGTAFAQTGDIRGFVYDKETGEPIIFTNVYLKGTQTGSVTDVNGFFSIAKVPQGDYILFTTYVGYDTSALPVSLQTGEIITKKIFISKQAYLLKLLSVSAEAEESRTEVQTSLTKITPKQIRQLPSVSGEPDLIQYLQVLPGVIFTGEQGGQLYIRGGAPIQNKILLDGMTLYNAFHSIGTASVFETDIIRNVEVYTGGFGAEYGGRLSAIIDITTRDGNKRKFAGKLGMTPFASKLILEGPIRRLREDREGGSSSFIIAAKQSYIEQTSRTLYAYADSFGLPYTYRDLYGKLSMHGENGSRINFFGFNFTDKVNYRGTSRINWSASGGGTDFVMIPGSSTVLIDGNFAWSDYQITLQEADEQPRNSGIGGFNLGLNFTYFFPSQEIKYGIDILGFKTEFEFFNLTGIRIEQDQNTTELAGYIKYKKTFEKLVLDPGLRLHYYASLGVLSPEPRLGVKWNLAKKLRLKFAGGLYSQNLISALSERDVVNLFSGFLSGPEEQLNNVDGDPARNNLQTALHGVGGMEFDVSKSIRINLESYYKDFTQLININRNKLYASDPDFMAETGEAYGADLLLTYDHKRWYLWLAYSLAYTIRSDGQQTYYPHFDRRHNANVAATYTFGKRRDMELSGRWNLGSGFPFTQTQGFYELITFQDGINTDYTTTNGTLGVLYGELNGGRLPYYHRLDVALRKTFALGKNKELECSATVTNVYNRENIFYFDRIRYERVNQLPVLPSIGASLSF